MDPIALSIFASRIEAVCDEMGAVLRRAAFSPNIRDRLDFSCAVFDAGGELCAQAAHIPVHLGSMAYAMRGIVSQRDWSPGDVLVVNDPYLGGTHLPDVTAISPLFHGGQLAGFVANRAHHADIGAAAPGSMPIARHLDEEGQVIPPSLLVRAGKLDAGFMDSLTGCTTDPAASRGDFSAQLSANGRGVACLAALVGELGLAAYTNGLAELNDYGERLARAALEDIPDGRYGFTDYMDDDGCGQEDLPITVMLEVAGGQVTVDFTGTAGQVPGNINCPLPVAAAGVYYVFRCLMPAQTPACAGSMRPLTLSAPAGCLVNARRPAAVAAGNVETSTRIVDVILGALAQAIPARVAAASHGSMNNIAMGSRRAEQPWSYYETIGGGMGASAAGSGLSGLQTHMTNTLNTPIEVLEMSFPLRITRYALRSGSGGVGRHAGGDGLIREYEFLAPAQVTLLTERRRRTPWGLAGGGNGMAGENWLDGQPVAGKVVLDVGPGQRLTLLTPGGGAWGKPAADVEFP